MVCKMKNKDVNLELCYFNPPAPPYGKDRRNTIITWFKNNPNGRIAVNCSYRPKLKNDSDLKKLLKNGFLLRNDKEKVTFLELNK